MMRKLISILFFTIFCSVLSAQNIITDGNAHAIAINGELITGPGPVNYGESSPPSPEPEWEDSVDFDLLFLENWDDYAIQTTLTADTLAAHSSKFESASSSGADSEYDNAGIIYYDGSNVMESRYPEDQCCTEAASDPYSNGGTGMDARWWITDESTYYDTVVFYCNIRPDADFINGAGTKMPAISTTKGGWLTDGRGRLMIVDWMTNMDGNVYTHAYWDGFSNPVIYASNAFTIDPDTYFTRGEWTNVAYVCYTGSPGGSNGWMEVFINGEFVYRRSSIPFIASDDPIGWSYFEGSTFMGGDAGTEEDAAGYMSPQNQRILHDDWLITTPPATYSYPSSTGSKLYIPDAANYPKTTE